MGELRLLIDSVLANRNVCKLHTRQLIDKLSHEGGKYFKTYARHIVNLDDWQKDEKSDYFYNIELLCEAIESGKQVEFFYNSYDVNKKLRHRYKHKYSATPYQLFLKGGRYYVAVRFYSHDNIAYCRIDRLTELQILNEPAKPLPQVNGYEQGINLGRLTNSFPYLFEDEPQHVEFVTANGANMVDHVIDWFGNDVTISELPDGNCKFSLLASPGAMKFWLLQYGKSVRALSPQSLVDAIKSDIQAMQKLYD